MRRLCKFIKQLLSQEDKIQKECIMNKEQIKESIKTISAYIKGYKAIARKHVDEFGPQANAQGAIVKAKYEVRGLLIAYAYLNGKPFSAPEQKQFDPSNSSQYIAIVKAKAALGMTEPRVYPSMTVHKPLPHTEFDAWLKNTVSAAQ
jgi:hypothetical protein